MDRRGGRIEGGRERIYRVGDRSGEQFPSVGVSSENGVVRRVSSAILRQFQDESADPLPQAPTTNPCFLNPRDGFPRRSIPIHRGAEGRPKYHRTAATGCFSRNTMGGRGKKMPWNGRVSVEFILIISTFFLRRETHLPATEENLLRSFSFFLSFTPPLSISSSSFLLFFSLF